MQPEKNDKLKERLLLQQTQLKTIDSYNKLDKHILSEKFYIAFIHINEIHDIHYQLLTSSLYNVTEDALRIPYTLSGGVLGAPNGPKTSRQLRFGEQTSQTKQIC